MCQILFLLSLVIISVLSDDTISRDRANTLCKEIKALRRSGALQWEPDCTNQADIALGVLPPSNAEKPRADARIEMEKRKFPTRPQDTKPLTVPAKLPESYDARSYWGGKCPSFNHIAYQGQCANCWTVAATAMINDRICMFNKPGQNQTVYSAKHMTICNGENGLVTGGDKRMHQAPGCQSYPWTPTEMVNTNCSSTCDNGKNATDKEKHFGGRRFTIWTQNETEIMMEIYMFGPIVARFMAYEDLACCYKKGVYKHVKGEKVGWHALKIFGWGIEDGKKYWYGTNSWGNTWGDNGFMKIERGTNECWIESSIFVAVPREGLL